MRMFFDSVDSHLFLCLGKSWRTYSKSYENETHPFSHETIHTIGDRQKETEHGKERDRPLSVTVDKRACWWTRRSFRHFVGCVDVAGWSHSNQC